MNTNKSKGKRLFRSKTNSVIGGVAGGLGEFFDTDPIVFRLLFVVSLIFGGAGIFVYIIMWLVIPIDESKGILIDKENIKQGADEMASKASKFKEDADTFSNSGSKKLIGLVLVVFGAVFLLQNIGLFRLFDYIRFWPIVFIILGVYLLSKKN